MTSRVGQGSRHIKDAKDATFVTLFVDVLGSREAGNETCVMTRMCRQKKLRADCDINRPTIIMCSSCVIVWFFPHRNTTIMDSKPAALIYLSIYSVSHFCHVCLMTHSRLFCLTE